MTVFGSCSRLQFSQARKAVQNGVVLMTINTIVMLINCVLMMINGTEALSFDKKMLWSAILFLLNVCLMMLLLLVHFYLVCKMFDATLASHTLANWKGVLMILNSLLMLAILANSQISYTMTTQLLIACALMSLLAASHLILCCGFRMQPVLVEDDEVSLLS